MPQIRSRPRKLTHIPALLISHLAVHKKFQRRGFGTKLLKLVFHIASKLHPLAGCRYVMLNPRDDEGVRQFYDKYGFEYYSNFNDDKDSDAFLMDLKNSTNINDDKDCNNFITNIQNSSN